ncbi:MAG TPA: potassium-transporting ATPase subunit KdpB [Candidatus Sulfotelmatobacter sp.]|nr:potassium-transporting ATPase subunit KdpB [Candidatus Sulfotelmatobacter sp.]
MVSVTPRQRSLFDRQIILPAIRDSFVKLDPRTQVRNPVMFIVEVGALVTLFYALRDARAGTAGFDIVISLWLWFTVLFANFAEAVAEGRGKAQAEFLRRTKSDTYARRLVDGREERVVSSTLRRGDRVVAEAGDVIATDGEIVQGAATVDESAITGESAPVIREAGGDRSSVTGGTRVLSDRIVFQVSANPGESFLDRMIALVEGAQRQKTPNEIALSILLSGLTIIFLIAVATLAPFSLYAGTVPSVVVLIALLVCLIPTTIGGLLSAIGIAGMDRVLQRNVLATSGRAVEAAGDVDTLLLDKTGTITLGNRQATEIIPAPGVDLGSAYRAAYFASLADETPEGRSIVTLAAPHVEAGDGKLPADATIVPFSAYTRMSGVDYTGGRRLRKGAPDAVRAWVGETSGGTAAQPLAGDVERIARAGGTPLLLADENRVLGAIYLRDVLKPNMRERFDRLRAMGIRTVMITGDNPLTASAIAREAGVEDFLAEATPETKMALIKREQAAGRLVAMTGDGTNDAPALAQADVGLAMNSGTQAAKEAGNMVDLDSDPTKLIEVVEVGKQLLMTRGALTTFSIANDVAKYFAILPAMFSVAYPEMDALNVMRLATPQSAILSAVIFNAVIIIALIPLALRGVRYRPRGANAVLRENVLIYGLGGIVVPFVGIKLIDLILVALHLTGAHS